MDYNIEQLYYFLVEMPSAENWPEEMKDNPMLGQGFYSFCRGLRMGFSLGYWLHEE